MASGIVLGCIINLSKLFERSLSIYVGSRFLSLLSDYFLGSYKEYFFYPKDCILGVLTDFRDNLSVDALTVYGSLICI